MPIRPWPLPVPVAVDLACQLLDALAYAHAEGYVAFEVPKFISLGVIVVIFGIALSYALLKEKKESKNPLSRIFRN